MQVSSEESAFLIGRAERRAEIHLAAPATRTPATAFNITARVKGRNGRLRPLVVMTPRSGWYSCASERGGGIVCWLELMRTFARQQPERDVMFVASSGHELGHLGIDAFIERYAGIVKQSAGWIHLGANIGAAMRPGTAAARDDDPAQRHAAPAAGGGNTIQASDDELEAVLSRAMSDAGLGIGRRNPRGTVPGGEAEAVHRGGGRYVSVIGGNALFHNPADRGAVTVDVQALVRFTRAFGSLANELAAASA